MSSFLQNRYGISAISKKYKSKAVPQEIMIDKDSGEIQIRIVDGTVVSYNYLSRLNAHVDTFVFNSYNADLYGKVYELEIGNLDLPCKVEKEVNLLDSPLELTADDFKAFMISIDVDAIEPDTLISKLDLGEVPIEIEIEYTVNTAKSVIKLSEFLYKINRMKIYKTDLNANATKPTIKSIKIGNNEFFEGHEKFILHSILVNIE